MDLEPALETMWRLQSNGVAIGTYLHDGQGNPISLDGVVLIKWEISSSGLGRLTLVAEASVSIAGDSPAESPDGIA